MFPVAHRLNCLLCCRSRARRVPLSRPMAILAAEEDTHMAKLTSAALAAHELGLAATFGGILFGETGLGKSVKVLPNQADRSRVIEQAWKTYSVPSTIGLVTAAATWFIGRTAFSGRFMGRKMRRLILAKDLALGVTLASGLAAQFVGRKLSDEQPFPVETNGRPSEGASEQVVKLSRLARVLGFLELIGAGTTLVLTSALNFRGQRNSTWNAIARVLP